MKDSYVVKENYSVCAGVELGANAIIEDYCIVGAPPRGTKEGDLTTTTDVELAIAAEAVSGKSLFSTP